MEKAINPFSEKEIIEVNNLLHQLLGSDIIEVKIEGRAEPEYFEGEKIIFKTREETLDLMKQISKEAYLDIYRFLHFYHPRWIAYNFIRYSGEYYAEFSANNELLLALTSIIDFIDGSKRYKKGYTKKFIKFLKRNLSEEDVASLADLKIYSIDKSDNGYLISINNVGEFGEYLYKLRSLIVHEAELGGIYHYRASFKFDFEKGKIDSVAYMITPEVFRKLLWKAIFKSRGLDIII